MKYTYRDKWPYIIAGFVRDWLTSRKWPRIFRYSIPTLLLILLAGVVVAGGANPTKLRNHYLQLGRAELERWQNQLAKAEKNKKPNADRPLLSEETTDIPIETAEQSSQSGTAESNDERKLSSYAEMLFRRVHLLEPNEESQFVIGTAFWQRGENSDAQRMLEKIAPKDKTGYPAAHAVLAKICREKLSRTPSPELIREFQHHANIAVNWSSAFPEILLENANLLWQQQKSDDSLKYLTQASKSHPQFYALTAVRAQSVKQEALAQINRKEGIEHYQADLQENPDSESSRIQLAQLLQLDPEGSAVAEQLLVEGLQQVPTSNAYARALSDIYRIRFSRNLEQSKEQSVETSLLERALQLDSTNPEIAQVIANLMFRGHQVSEKLESELNRVLASGKATTGTHAILSQYHINNRRYSQAITHLEQVYKAAPLEIRLSNNLAYFYAKEGRHADAERVATETLSLINLNGAHRNRFVDELLDTLGMIYQTQGKTSDAIASYESCLKLNPRRIQTREHLIVLYRRIGNVGVADAHEEAIQKIKKENAEK